MFPYNICAPALGIARGAVAFYIENAKHRSAIKFWPPNFGPQAMHLRLVEAGAQIDSAEAVLTKNAAELNAIGRAGGQPTPEQQARSGRDLSYAAQLFMKAVDGIRAKIGSFARHHINVSLSKAKMNGQYTNSVLAKREAKLGGYDEAILLDANGYVTATLAEVLPISSDDGFGKGILSTPPANQAAGISASDRITKPASPTRQP